MKSNYLFIIIAILFISCNNYQPDSRNRGLDRTARAKVSVTNRYFDFGSVSKSQFKTIPFSFTVYNNTDSIIQIVKIDVACRCIVINEHNNALDPLDSIKIGGYIDLKNQRGHFNKCIYVNYGIDELLLLRIKGDVEE